MRNFFLIAVACLFFTSLLSQSKNGFIDKVKFFENDSILDVTFTTDMGKLLNTKLKPDYMPATFSCRIFDSSISEQIRVIARGNVRRQICYMPPLKLDFHNTTSPTLYTLSSLKLVCACNTSDDYDQLLLKEYLVYKIYNLLTDKSFHARLLNINYEDAKGKKKNISQHAFLLEDIKDVAKRNQCKDLKNVKLHSEYTDRKQMTMVAIFEYMIGNTDWGVSANHNTVLMRLAEDSTSRPFVVPYDFDYSGLVNADYAVPSERLDIENVRQRLYRGYPRTLDEVNDALSIFKQQKENIYLLINKFELLTPKNRQEIIDYLDDFYKTISNENQVKYTFIDQALGT